ncbi:hypothetical protein OCU04_004175 [Sclerotinia nivalis]|uniref:Uncharacterized protein n=1 Tax=Sclerotinia nivalis TaxID=352851 RepID=A0A9X0APY3_9HELO|nr:hypothetical protein OCU04_004175 [Sclerotinia nivalis]
MPAMFARHYIEILVIDGEVKRKKERRITSLSASIPMIHYPRPNTKMPPLPHHLSHTLIRNPLIRHSPKIHALLTSFSLLLGLNGLNNTYQLRSMEAQVKKSRDDMNKMSRMMELIKVYGPMMELKKGYKVELGLYEEGEVKRTVCFEMKEDHRAEEGVRVEGGELGKIRKVRDTTWRERMGELRDRGRGRNGGERVEGKANAEAASTGKVHVEQGLAGMEDIEGMRAIHESDGPGPTEWKSTELTKKVEALGGTANVGKATGNQEDTKRKKENGGSEKSANVDDVN